MKYSKRDSIKNNYWDNIWDPSSQNTGIFHRHKKTKFSYGPLINWERDLFFEIAQRIKIRKSNFKPPLKPKLEVK